MNIGIRQPLANKPNEQGGFALLETLIVLLLVALVCAGALQSLARQRTAVEAMKAESSRIVQREAAQWSFVSLPDGSKVWVRTFPPSH
jgi:type II secretory pathway pseudopilin PulG